MAEGTYVSELEEGALVEATFAVQRKRRRRTRNGDPFLSLELADRTGRVPAVVWNDVNLLGGRFDEGDTVRVLGRVESYDGRPQIAIRDLQRLDGGDALELVPGARRDAETLDGMLEFLAGEIHDTALAALVGAFVDDDRFRERLRTAPASEAHHAYAGGLLEHTVAVTTLCHEVAALHPRLRTDLLLAAALLHDAGRTETFRPGVTIAESEQGRLLGHVLAGVRMIDAAARGVGLDDERLLPLLNAVAGHHGPLEGRRLETPEAVCLYQANALDARVAEALQAG
jgi:3'-5' exoribonuclease